MQVFSNFEKKKMFCILLMFYYNPNDNSITLTGKDPK